MMSTSQIEVVGGQIVIFNVAQLLKSDVGSTRNLVVDEAAQPFGDDVQAVRPIRGSVSLIRTNRGIVGQGRFSTAVDLECSRCLERYVEDLEIEFAEEFIPIVDVNTGAPSKIEHDEGTFLINDKHELNLEPAIREYGLLALPMKPLCKVSCAGLCPRCGANKNFESCACVLDEPDERLAVLRALLSDDES
jgi:uncharacterized protein